MKVQKQAYENLAGEVLKGAGEGILPVRAVDILAINKVLNRLDKEKSKAGMHQVIILYYGLNGAKAKDLNAIASALSVPHKRAARLYDDAIKKMRSHNYVQPFKRLLRSELERAIKQRDHEINKLMAEAESTWDDMNKYALYRYFEEDDPDNLPIFKLEWSAAVYHFFNRASIETFADLLHPISELREIEGCDKNILSEIIQVLKSIGLKLKE